MQIKGMVGIALLILITPLVSADVLTPLSEVMIPFIPVVIISETIGFWLLVNKFFKIKTGFWKSLVIMTVANIITSLLGTFIQLYRNVTGPLLLAFILSIIIEFIVYLFFFGKAKIEKIKLLVLSLIVNSISYTLLLLIFAILILIA